MPVRGARAREEISGKARTPRFCLAFLCTCVFMLWKVVIIWEIVSLVSRFWCQKVNLNLGGVEVEVGNGC